MDCYCCFLFSTTSNRKRFYINRDSEETKHFTSHTNRRFFIKNNNKYRNIRSQYMQLETCCWKARYSGERTTKNDAIKMLDYLRKIEQFFLNNQK